MKKSILSLMAIVLTIGLFSFIGKNSPETIAEQNHLVGLLESAKAYTLEVAEMMDAADYTFKPSDSVKTFGEQLTHIGMSTQFLTKSFIKGEQVPFDPVEGAKMEKEVGASKEATIKQINAGLDEAIQTVKDMSADQFKETFIFEFAPNKPKLTKAEGILFIRDHITHHRAQCITYLRMKGHKPPAYRPF